VGIDVYESYGPGIMKGCKTYTLVFLSKTFLCVCIDKLAIFVASGTDDGVRDNLRNPRFSSVLTPLIVRKILIKSGPKREDARGG